MKIEVKYVLCVRSDRIIPPDAERQFAQRMNATTISLNSSHASLVSHPDEIAQLILNATKEAPRNITEII